MKVNSNVLLVATVVTLLTGSITASKAADPPTLMTERAAARFLEQATWGPNAESIAQLQQVGINNWLDWQFSLKTSDLPDQPIDSFDFTPIKIAFFDNAVRGDDQLRQRVAFALSETWVVSAIEIPQAYAFPPYWRIFRDAAFGNYRDIIRAVTLNPAMGRYLNVANSDKGDPARGTVANENFARELLQLFTLGLVQLNVDGSPVVDQNGHQIPTFDSTVVHNMAKALTGWTYPVAPGAIPTDHNPPFYIGSMYSVFHNHDTSAKNIFGNITIPPNQTAEQDLEMILDALMQQQTMAPFICRQMIQHMVTSNPSPAYIQRVSQKFLDNGDGVRGDLKAVIKAILTDPEARAGDIPGNMQDSRFGHLREPVLFLSNIMRGLNATLANNSPYPFATMQGQDLFRAPSVFSYFSTQYQVENGLFGPEFQIYSPQAALIRANAIDTILGGWYSSTSGLDTKSFQESAKSVDDLLAKINKIFLNNSMSPDLHQAIYQGIRDMRGSNRVYSALYLALTSGEYQVIH